MQWLCFARFHFAPRLAMARMAMLAFSEAGRRHSGIGNSDIQRLQIYQGTDGEDLLIKKSQSVAGILLQETNPRSHRHGGCVLPVSGAMRTLQVNGEQLLFTF